MAISVMARTRRRPWRSDRGPENRLPIRIPDGLAASAMPINTGGASPAKWVNASTGPCMKIGARIGYGIATPTVLIRPRRQTAARIQYGCRTCPVACFAVVVVDAMSCIVSLFINFLFINRVVGGRLGSAGHSFLPCESKSPPPALVPADTSPRNSETKRNPNCTVSHDIDVNSFHIPRPVSKHTRNWSLPRRRQGVNSRSLRGASDKRC